VKFAPYFLPGDRQAVGSTVMTPLFLLRRTRCDAKVFHKKKKINKSTSAENTAEPDKILFMTRRWMTSSTGGHEVGG